jgi:hypothetical protein
MKGRHLGRVLLAAGASAFVVCGLACVDLFHGTDFATLCTTSPNDPACPGAEGDGGSAESSVDGGTDAARPHPDFCAWSTDQARAQAEHACAWLGACEGPTGESAFGPCVVRAQLAFDCHANPGLRPAGAVDAFWGCLSTVTTCRDVDACVFPGGVQPCVAVPTGSSSACGLAANAADHIVCSGPAGRAYGVEPCAMLGKTCAAENTSVATCSGSLRFDACTVTTCSGSNAVTCSTSGRTLDNGFDCAGYGAGRCEDTGDAGPTCVPGGTTTACFRAPTVACSGSKATSCAGGKEVDVDCALLDLTCDISQPVDPIDPSGACVVRSTSACAAADACDVNKLTSCGRGGSFTIDCTKVGLGRCEVKPTGEAFCIPPP